MVVIAPPRNWLTDQRSYIRNRIAEEKRFNARTQHRQQLMLRQLSVRSDQLDTFGERSWWKRILRRIAA